MSASAACYQVEPLEFRLGTGTRNKDVTVTKEDRGSGWQVLVIILLINHDLEV